MKNSTIKKLCSCYGDKDKFMKMRRCYVCGYRKRCLLKVNKMEVFAVTN